ncbi:hypothetical protein CEXT_310811 [Caerostris extrusa]|uniref:Uncharacterized protein n=1 Tax=Caerostris extrusa TaxID=172846 RepID=A0AAV4S275_CAEEX|nr:hypothetical protein CEXT_310811 [Caerostris extrusa]
MYFTPVLLHASDKELQFLFPVHLLEQQQHLRLERSAARHYAETEDAETLVQPHRTDCLKLVRQKKAESIRYLHLDHCLIREFDAQICNEMPHLRENLTSVST